MVCIRVSLLGSDIQNAIKFKCTSTSEYELNLKALTEMLDINFVYSLVQILF